MKKGTFMVTLTKKLPSSDPFVVRDEKRRDWECVYSIKKTMSWGLATVNIHKKVL
jgi:hypothetical protein